MSTTNNYTAYTGTFTTQTGNTRTMTFIRNKDIPSSVIGSGKRIVSEGSEVVYDIEKGGLRTFNWNTVQGDVTNKTIRYSFNNHSQR
tara:strand:+ start:501 stop:761 length:261 start_codon:yes stop_codon:yes gene_type:complete